MMWIEFENEPDGEGNGWDSCLEEDATSFTVYEGESIGAAHCELVETFATRAEAEAFIKGKGWEPIVA